MAATPDLTEFVKLSNPKPTVCQVAAALGSLKRSDLAALQAALDTDKAVITDGAITAWLAARDLKASFAAVSHHRRGTCRCARG